jgi:hypothetical protein
MTIKGLVTQLAFFSGIAALAVPLFATQAQDLIDFKTCVTSGSGPQWNATTHTCTLPYYATPYAISSAISITSSNVRVISTGSGGVASGSTKATQATLQRNISSFSGTPSTFAILSTTGSGPRDLLIQNLIVDGNRWGQNMSGSPVLGCNTNTLWIDLDLNGSGWMSGTSSWPGVSVTNVNFENSPGYALDLGQKAYVYSSDFNYARIGGVYTNGNAAVNYNHQEYIGSAATTVNGANILVEYNTLVQDHDEWVFNSSGGQLFVAQNGSTNFTFLSNWVDGKNAYCPPGGCTVCPPSGCTLAMPGCTATSSSFGYLNEGIEVWNAGGTFNNNQLQNSYQGLFLGNVDGSGIGAVTGWSSLSKTTAGQAVTFLNNDPSWTLQSITGNGKTGLAQSDGVNMFYTSALTGNFGGAFSFTDLRSLSNVSYGFEWNMGTQTPKAGTTLSWGTANAACLVGNTSGAVGSMPAGFSGPASTTTDLTCSR